MNTKNLSLVLMMLTLGIYSSCDLIGDPNYKISELNGIYIIRNYLEDGGTIGPTSTDTLYFCNGKYRNRYFGEGEAEIDRQRTHAIIRFNYKNPLDENSTLNVGFHIDKRPFGKQRLTINSDLNYYYERISKTCPDVFEK